MPTAMSFILPTLDSHQRFRLVQSRLAGVLVLAVVGALHVGAAMGYVLRRRPLWWWAAAVDDRRFRCSCSPPCTQASTGASATRR